MYVSQALSEIQQMGFERLECFELALGIYITGITNPRLLERRVAPIFRSKQYEFHVEYIRAVRNWKESLPSVASLSGAFRKRNKLDEKLVPHSFSFIQRRCPLT